MKARRRRNLIGRACGVVAAVFLLLYGAAAWLFTLTVVSGDRRSALQVFGGSVIVYHGAHAQYGVWRISIENQWIAWPTDKNQSSLMPSPLAQATPPRAGCDWFPPFHLYLWPSLGAARWDDGNYRVPFWCLATPFGAVATATEVRHRRRLKRERIGVCPKCGYNRAGIAPDAPCPECGGRT